MCGLGQNFALDFKKKPEKRKENKTRSKLNKKAMEQESNKI
jgi:hypothetical protein